jgi:hypothetical protein
MKPNDEGEDEALKKMIKPMKRLSYRRSFKKGGKANEEIKL